MNGPRDNQQSPYALNANLRTGTAQSQLRRVWIYGLFDQIGLCHYVGQTVNRNTRKKDHALKYPSLQFVILRSCAPQIATKIETQVLTVYRRKGQCGHNKRKPVKATPKIERLIFSIELNKVFQSVNHACDELGDAPQTIKRYLSDGDPFNNIYRLCYLDYYNLNREKLLDYSI